jgi:DNA-binding SARP family transcriptional activator
VLFHVLGPVQAHLPDGDLPKARKPITVLATLLLHASCWVRTDTLIDATWPQVATPTSAEANLKTYIWQLRKALPPTSDGTPRIDSRPGAYRLRVGPGELDVDMAEALARQARTVEDPKLAEHCYAKALRLWRGEPFEGVRVQDTGVLAGLAELRRELRSGRADALARLGRTREAVAELRTLTEQDPLCEGSWAQWMRVLCAAGRHEAALAVYDKARSLLNTELGADPGEELAGAHRYALAAIGATRHRDLPRELPFALPDFTGRSTELATLTGFGDGVVVIDGMAGVGKTALAVHAARRLVESYPDGQLYVDVADHTEPAQLLDRLLRRLDVLRIPAGLADRAARWRAELAGRRVVVVLDDARSAAQVWPLLPGEGCVVLVTTRSRRLTVDGARHITLDPLPRADAIALFRAAVADWRAEVEPAAVADVIRRCGSLPLAIRAAAARLRARPAWTVTQLAERLVASGELDGVTEVFDEAVRSAPPGPHRVLTALAVLPGDVTAGKAATVTGGSVTAARRALEDLLDRHLVVQRGADRFGLHPLIRDAALRASHSSPLHLGGFPS